MLRYFSRNGPENAKALIGIVGEVQIHPASKYFVEDGIEDGVAKETSNSVRRRGGFGSAAKIVNLSPMNGHPRTEPGRRR